jgi:hypothetical protein
MDCDLSNDGGPSDEHALPFSMKWNCLMWDKGTALTFSHLKKVRGIALEENFSWESPLQCWIMTWSFIR